MTHRRPTLSTTGLTGLAAALALALTACSGDTDADAGSSGPTLSDATDAATSAEDQAATSTSEAALDAFPVTLDTVAGEITIPERPERIVSLSPSATEILFAIGAGDQVVAVDEWSTYPTNAPVTDLSGFEPNIEAITSYEPDLVVISNDINDIVASLGALDIPVLVSPAPLDIESGYDGMAALGLATGRADETAAAVADLRAAIDEALAAAPKDAQVRVYHELDNTFYAASSHSFIGSIYSAMGAVNIADEADADATGYPQLTEEAIITADPELIVISDLSTYTAEDVAARPGWAGIDAVTEGVIVAVNADLASRWGPRLPELITSLADALNAAAVPAGR